MIFFLKMKNICIIFKTAWMTLFVNLIAEGEEIHSEQKC